MGERAIGRARRLKSSTVCRLVQAASAINFSFALAPIQAASATR